MKLFKFADFLKDEDGAVTVDWVVLTSAIVGLGLAVMLSVGGSATDVANTAAAELANTPNINWQAQAAIAGG